LTKQKKYDIFKDIHRKPLTRNLVHAKFTMPCGGVYMAGEKGLTNVKLFSKLGMVASNNPRLNTKITQNLERGFE